MHFDEKVADAWIWGRYTLWFRAGYALLVK